VDNIIPKLNKACFAIRSVKTFYVIRSDEINLFFLFPIYSNVWDYIFA
jgi:hypothetical protein